MFKIVPSVSLSKVFLVSSTIQTIRSSISSIKTSISHSRSLITVLVVLVDSVLFVASPDITRIPERNTPRYTQQTVTHFNREWWGGSRTARKAFRGFTLHFSRPGGYVGRLLSTLPWLSAPSPSPARGANTKPNKMKSVPQEFKRYMPSFVIPM